MTPRTPLDYAAYVFDLDGTIYRGPYLIDGVGQMLANLRRKGKIIRFLSNKPIQTRQTYAEKLRQLGVQADDEEVMNSSTVAAKFLRQHHLGARLYVVGEGPLICELVEAGLEIVDDGDKCDLLLLSFDRGFDYMKLHHAMLAARRGVPILATNPDVVCPVEDGFIPDCGAIMAAVEACSGKKVDVIIGKPSEIMLETILEDLGLPAEEVLLVGDRLETDMTMGRKAGMGTALVLTGVTTPEQAAEWPERPNYVLESASEIAGFSCW